MKRSIACAGLFAPLGLIGLSLSFAEPNAASTQNSESLTVKIRLFHGEQQVPIAEHTILFDQEILYALPSSDQEHVTVIDEARHRVWLLDRSTQTRTLITTDDLLSMTARLRSSASSKELQQRLGILANVAADEDSGVYSVAYGGIEYSTTTQKPSDRNAALKFGRFSDWASRLNIARKVGMPPFGRMQMNSQIATDGRIPLETKLRFQQGDVTQYYRSTHEVASSITVSDRDRINEIEGMLKLYKEIPFAQLK